MSFRINSEWPAEYAARHTSDIARDKKLERRATERRIRRDKRRDHSIRRTITLTTMEVSA